MARRPDSKTKSEKLLARIKRSSPPAIRLAHQGIKMYDPVVVEEICERLASGESLKNICRDGRMPNWTTVYRWMRQHPEFKEQVNTARALQEEYILDDVIDIAQYGADPDEEGNSDVRRDKLVISTHFKRLAILEAKRKERELPKEMKVVDATQDKNGGWKVLENGQRANPMSEAIANFLTERGMEKNEA